MLEVWTGTWGGRELEKSRPELGGCCALGSHGLKGNGELAGSHAFSGSRASVGC